MKTKRLFLKLFLAVCFLMAVPVMRVEAAATLNINTDDITIDGHGAYFGKSYTVGTTQTYSPDTSGFTITDNGTQVTQPREIIVDVGNTNTLILTFNSLSAPAADLKLNIKTGNVRIILKNSNDLACEEGSAITIANGATLTFQANDLSDNITVRGGKHAVTSGSSATAAVQGGTLTVQGGTVTLIAGDNTTSTKPFIGASLNVPGGLLRCYNTEGPTHYGDGNLNQTTGSIEATGLAKVDTKTETIVDLEGNSNSYNFSIKGPNDPVKTPIPESAISNYSAIKILDGPNGWHGKDFIIEGKTANTFTRTIHIPKRIEPAPSGQSVQNHESISGAHDASIRGVDADMEYSTDDGKTWNPCIVTNRVMSGLNAGTYIFRYAAIEDTSFASENSNPVTINRGNTITVGVSSSTFDNKPFNYTELPKEINVVVENLDKNGGTIKINDIIATNNDKTKNEEFTITGGTFSLGAGYKDDTCVIQPISGLSAGTHKASILVEFENRDGKKGTYFIEDAVQFNVSQLAYGEGEKLEEGEQLTPGKPEAESKTFNSITLKAMPDGRHGAKVQYSIDGGKTWGDPGVREFTGLESEQNYTFIARYAETTNYKESDPGEHSDPIKTEKKASIIYSTKQLSLIPNHEYQISIEGNPEIYDTCVADTLDSSNQKSLLDIKDKWFGKTIELKDNTNGTTQSLKIPDIGKAPTSPKGEAESFSSAGDGKIRGVTTSMEYKLKGSNDDWVTCPDKTIENLAAGTYLVRTKAVDEGSGDTKKYTFASDALEVVVGRGSALRISPAEKIDFGTSKYKVLPDAKKIVLQNRDQYEDITIKSITLSDDSPFAILHKETDSVIVAPSKDNQTFQIQPKPDLNVGTYSDKFVVTYEVGYNSGSNGGSQIQAQAEGFNADLADTSGQKSDEITVTFTVEKGTQEAPPVPAEKSVKSTSITLETIPNSTVSGAKAQYSKDGGKTWQDSPTFNKLKADTEYYFVSRYAATDNYNESEISNGENAITTEEKDADKDDDDNSGNKNVSSNANGSTGSNGSNGSGTNGSGTTGTNGNGTTGTNGTGTNGTNSGSGSNSSRLTSARTGDLNNIQLWVALMIGSYLSSYLIIKDRIKKAKAK